MADPLFHEHERMLELALIEVRKKISAQDAIAGGPILEPDMIPLKVAAGEAGRDKETVARWRRADGVGEMVGGVWMVPRLWLKLRLRPK